MTDPIREGEIDHRLQKVDKKSPGFGGFSLEYFPQGGCTYANLFAPKQMPIHRRTWGTPLSSPTTDVQFYGAGSRAKAG